MTYRVAFAKRFQSNGTESTIDPTVELDVYLADGIVADKQFVERFEPEAKHSQEVLDEDDAFLGSASAEVWEYEVLDDRASEFEDAIRNAHTVLEFEIIDDTVTDTTDLTSGTPLGDGDSSTPLGVPGGGTLDDGPAGMRTARGDQDSSPGGGLDDLTIVRADDPNLGLTNYGKRGPQDWAADAGPGREPGRGTITADPDDDRSTLSPDDGRHRRIVNEDKPISEPSR